MEIFKEFQEFAVKGNVIDLAVGMIIGAEFGKIVNSMVADIIMPPIGFVLGNIDFKNLYILLKEGSQVPGPYGTLADAAKAGAITLNVGSFFTSVLSFVIIAFCVFMVVKAANRMRAAKLP